MLAAAVLDCGSAGIEWSFDTVRGRIAERLHLIEPLHSRPAWGGLGRPCFVDDPAVDLHRHLHHVVLPEGGGLDALAEVAGRFATQPLPKDRPLWAAWFVEGFEKDHVALLAKIHHSAVDGVFGIFALAGLFDLTVRPAKAEQSAGVAPEPEPATRGGRRALLGAKVDELRQRPGLVARGVRQAAGSATAFRRSLGERPPLPLSGKRMSYNRALTARRSVAFAALHLHEVHEVRKAFGASVNDVVVALSAGALRRHAIQCDELPDRPLVATIPVSERAEGDATAGNQLAFMFYNLPVHLEDAGERLRFVQRTAEVAKEAHLRGGQGLLSSVAALIPKFVVGSALRAASSLRVTNVVPPIANVMISSLRGPDVPLYMARASLASIFPLGAVFEGIGLSITAISYRDELAFGFITCTDLVPDIRELATGLHLEMANLLDAAAAARGELD